MFPQTVPLSSRELEVLPIARLVPNPTPLNPSELEKVLTGSRAAFAGLRLRNQSVCLLKQEMEKDPVTPMPHVKLEIKPCLGQAFRLSQLDRNRGMVSEVVERHRRDYVNHCVGQRHPGDAVSALASAVESIREITTPELKQGQPDSTLGIMAGGLLLQRVTQ